MPKFETRGVISDDFTFESVRKAAKEIASSLKTDKPLIVGYDARFLADKFAEEVVKIMEGAGIFCFLTERDTPTPVVAWEVKDKGAAGAVMITAASNPPEYCGIKFIPGVVSRQLSVVSSKVERFEPRERYLAHISSLVDGQIIRKARLKVAVDPMYGSGRGYLDKLLQKLGCQVEEIHNYRDVLFGGLAPDPVEENLAELRAKVVETGSNLGVALNGEASSFAVVNEKGSFSRPETKDGDGILSALLWVESLCYNKVKGR